MGVNFNGWLNAIGIDGTGEAMNRDGICRAFTGEDNAYWVKLLNCCAMPTI